MRCRGLVGIPSSPQFASPSSSSSPVEELTENNLTWETSCLSAPFAELMDGILRCTNPPPRNNISMAYMKSSVRHDSCTIYICTRARLSSCQSLQRKINWPGNARGMLSANKETNKSWASIAVRHKRRTVIAPTMHAYALALIVEFVHINLGRGAGLVLLCLSLASRWVHRTSMSYTI